MSIIVLVISHNFYYMHLFWEYVCVNTFIVPKGHLTFFKNKPSTFLLWFIGLIVAGYPDTPYNKDYGWYMNLRIDLISPVQNSILYHVAGAAAVMIAIINSKRAKKILSNKYICSLGAVSFSLYLMHALALESFSSFIF